MKDMKIAPRDGTEIIGIYQDGSKELIFWNDERYCMLGARNGSFPCGWSSAEGIISRHLPLDEELFIGWKDEEPYD